MDNLFINRFFINLYGKYIIIRAQFWKKALISDILFVFLTLTLMVKEKLLME